MDDRFPGSLGCTANDVRIARVDHISTPKCILGSTFSFSADFFIELTAQTRFDIGLYFAVDGDPNKDGALTGQCAVNTISHSSSVNFINLDPAPDA